MDKVIFYHIGGAFSLDYCVFIEELTKNHEFVIIYVGNEILVFIYVYRKNSTFPKGRKNLLINTLERIYYV